MEREKFNVTVMKQAQNFLEKAGIEKYNRLRNTILSLEELKGDIVKLKGTEYYCLCAFEFRVIFSFSFQNDIVIRHIEETNFYIEASFNKINNVSEIKEVKLDNIDKRALDRMKKFHNNGVAVKVGHIDQARKRKESHELSIVIPGDVFEKLVKVAESTGQSLYEVVVKTLANQGN